MVVYRVKPKKKNNTTMWAVAGLVACAVIAIVVTRKQGAPSVQEAAPAEQAPAATPSIPEGATGTDAPAAFTDPRLQARFAAVYGSITNAFTAPKPGSPLRIVKKNGLRVEGELLRFTPTGLVLSTPDGLLNITREEMDDATRQRLFVEDFSRALAEQRVRSEPPGSASADLDALFLADAPSGVIEPRRFTCEVMTARYGPGRHYTAVPGTELYRGQLIFVVAETNGWICIKESQGSPKPMGWIPKFASLPTNPQDRNAIQREVKELIDSGFVITVDPARNEALVDMYEWRMTDEAALEGKCRLIAFYCGHQRNSRLFWVDIRDALNNRKVAEYSESKGFRVF